MRCIIAHLDMDAFFAAVEERDRPRLRGLPIVVGADPRGGKGRGVVSTANYKAREYSIKSALPISKAWEFSENAKKHGKPPVVFLSGDFGKYSKVSKKIMDIVKNYSPLVEEAGVDEAYFDLSDSKSYNRAVKVAEKIKEEIKKKEKLTATIGIGPNKLVAKIASDIQKPNGLTVVKPENVRKFLNPLPIKKIPGVGPKTESILNNKGVRTVGELSKISKADLFKIFGKWGGGLYNKARGVTKSPIVTEYEIKSIGEQKTFAEDSSDQGYIIEKMKKLCKTVFRRLKNNLFSKFRTITITVRFSGFETINRSHTLALATGDYNEMEFEAIKLLLPFFDKRNNPGRKKIRLIGVRLEKLS